MTDTTPNTTQAKPTAKPTTYSIYQDQREWVAKEVTRLSEKTGRPFNPSKVIQHLIDQARKRKTNQQ